MGAVPARLNTESQLAQQVLAHPFDVESEPRQHLGRNAVLLSQKPQQDMLTAHIVAVEIMRLLDRVLNDSLGPRRLRQLADAATVRPLLDQHLHFESDLAQVHVEVLQDTRAGAATLFVPAHAGYAPSQLYSWFNRCASWLASAITFRRSIREPLNNLVSALSYLSYGRARRRGSRVLAILADRARMASALVGRRGAVVRVRARGTPPQWPT